MSELNQNLTIYNASRVRFGKALGVFIKPIYPVNDSYQHNGAFHILPDRIGYMLLNLYLHNF
jgi:hypothetical protein